MRPITSIPNPKFRYRPSGETDIRKSFAKARKEKAEADRKSAESIIRIGKMPAQEVTPFCLYVPRVKRSTYRY